MVVLFHLLTRLIYDISIHTQEVGTLYFTRFEQVYMWTLRSLCNFISSQF